MLNGCPVTATARNTYDHRLRNLVAAAGTAAVNDVMLPRSTVATWKRKGHLAVVSCEVFEQLSESRLRRWKARAVFCVLDDQVSCPKQQPSKLTFAEEQKMRDLVESHELRHFSIRALAMHARRIGALFGSDSTWWPTIHAKSWMRPTQRIHPESP